MKKKNQQQPQKIRLFTFPNLLTLCNLISGSLAVVFTLRYDGLQMAFFMIVAAAVFDFLDGFAARLFHSHSALGIQLDTLADVVSFGLAPSAILLSMFESSGGVGEIGYGVFILAAFSALRLAKFNIDDRQSTSFIGLPIPANALFWIGICFADTRNWHPGIILGLILLFSFLMVSNLPMFSLKASNLSWSDNKLRYILVITALGLIIWLGPTGLAGAIIAYILLSLAALLGKK